MSKFFEYRDKAIKDMIYAGDCREMYYWTQEFYYDLPCHIRSFIPDEFGLEFKIWAYQWVARMNFLSDTERGVCNSAIDMLLFEKYTNEE